MPKAVVLVSGGLDSATALAVAMRDGRECLPLVFDYGQRHAIELQAAGRVCAQLGAPEPRVIRLDLRAIGGSALTGDLEVPKDGPQAGIPVTYVPARNTLFLSYALAVAEVEDAAEVYIGVNAVDYSGYPDCRPEFIEAFERMANLATRAGVEGRSLHIRAPLTGMTKAEIIQLGTSLDVDYALTHSCYDPVGELACGQCDSCTLRRQGFQQAKIKDPTKYTQT
jgi:7-cyano-7-deazaguanine synthase